MHRTTPLVAIVAACLAACGSTAGNPATPQSEPATDRPSTHAASCPNTPARPPLGASPGACTEMGCRSGFTIDLEPSASWPAGRYTFELEADGKRQRCEGTLPLAACGQPSMTCSGDEIAGIGESGCALPAAQHAFGPIEIAEQPCAVQLTIRRDGALIGEQRIAPSYAWTQPNGAGCEPQCLQAPSTELTLTF